MPHDLITLIQTSGNAGTVGQSFLNHVTASAAGVAMMDYSISGSVSWTGQPALPVDLTYSSGQTFTLVGTFSQYGNKFITIRRNGSGNPPWSRIGTVTTTINSITWNEAGTVTAGVTVQGEYDPDTVPTLSSFFFYFRDYTSPTLPPNDDDYQVVLRRITNAGVPASGTDDLTLQLRYLPDPSLFNPIFDTPAWAIRIYKRALPNWDTAFEWESHDSNSYNNLKASSFLSGPNTEYDVYVRYRLRAEYNGGTPGSWTNYGQVTWSDPRPNI